MRRPLLALVVVAAVAHLLTPGPRAGAQGKQDWGTIKGRIVWGGKGMPESDVAMPGGADGAYCLKHHPDAKPNGTIAQPRYVVNAKNQGIQNVFVYILVEPGAQPPPIHPDLQKFPATLVIDQPNCAFFPRAITMREGQILVVKNSKDPFAHSFKWDGDQKNNEGGNINIKAGGKEEIKGLKAQRLPLPISCAQHTFMKGRLGVFTHPYYAVTDADGAFEMKLVPAGKHPFMIYHEEGYRLGPKGKEGEVFAIKAGEVTDLGDLPMGK